MRGKLEVLRKCLWPEIILAYRETFLHINITGIFLENLIQNWYVFTLKLLQV